MITDQTIIRIGQAVQLSHQGEREAARVLFAEIWDEIGGEQGDPLHTCTLAHAMADLQDDVHQELVWDQRALAAADLLTDARLAQAGVTLSVVGLYPSLHLNLSECYRKLGDLDGAREQLQQAQATIGALGDDGYAPDDQGRSAAGGRAAALTRESECRVPVGDPLRNARL